jgi:hypothetical protein
MVALLVAALAVVLFGAAALGVDIANQANERQELHDTLDMAAHAGAYELPAGNATAAALTFAHANDPASSPDIEVYCVVGSRLVGASYFVNSDHIPTSCTPGAPPYDAAHYPGLRCNQSLCAIPCDPTEGDQCNTVRAIDAKPVPFRFAPVLGYPAGSTGSISSAACKGACGSTSGTPIDFAVVADRTGSMSCCGATSDMGGLETAMKGLLEYLTPALHHVALGTIGRSSASAPANCLAQDSGSQTSGPWVPVGLSDDYDMTDVDPPSSPADLNLAGSQLVQAVDCFSENQSGTGTELASPLKFAARELLNNGRAGVKKGIIFMTDGQPNENTMGSAADLSLSTAADIGNSNGNTACNNARAVAGNAKAAGIMVVTVAYNLGGGERCNGSSTPTVLATLAAMASPRNDGAPSVDDGGGAGAGCDSAAKIAGENADDDYFYCTPAPADLEDIFRTAASQISGGIRLIKLP